MLTLLQARYVQGEIPPKDLWSGSAQIPLSPMGEHPIETRRLKTQREQTHLPKQVESTNANEQIEAGTDYIKTIETVKNLVHFTLAQKCNSLT